MYRIPALFFVILFIGCHTPKKAVEYDISLSGTVWRYTDHEWQYTIEFLPDGKLKSTHPNDVTPYNDRWRQRRDTVEFEFNDGYSRYKGHIKS